MKNFTSSIALFCAISSFYACLGVPGDLFNSTTTTSSGGMGGNQNYSSVSTSGGKTESNTSVVTSVTSNSGSSTSSMTSGAGTDIVCLKDTDCLPDLQTLRSQLCQNNVCIQGKCALQVRDDGQDCRCGVGVCHIGQCEPGTYGIFSDPLVRLPKTFDTTCVKPIPCNVIEDCDSVKPDPGSYDHFTNRCLKTDCIAGVCTAYGVYDTWQNELHKMGVTCEDEKFPDGGMGGFCWNGACNWWTIP